MVQVRWAGAVRSEHAPAIVAFRHYRTSRHRLRPVPAETRNVIASRFRRGNPEGLRLFPWIATPQVRLAMTLLPSPGSHYWSGRWTFGIGYGKTLAIPLRQTRGRSYPTQALPRRSMSWPLRSVIRLYAKCRNARCCHVRAELHRGVLNCRAAPGPVAPAQPAREQGDWPA